MIRTTDEAGDPLDDIFSSPPPSPVEAEANARRLRERNGLVEQFLPLVHAVAREFRHRGVEAEDLRQVGTIAFMRAAEIHDPSRVAFITYATEALRRAMRRAVGRATPVRIGPRAWRLVLAYRKAARGLTEALGRPPGLEEVAGEMGLSAARLRLLERALAAIRPAGSVAVTRTTRSGEEPGFDPGTPDEEGADLLEVGRLREAMRRLNPRMREVISLRFGLDGGGGREYGEIGERLGVTRQRAKQIEAAARERQAGALLRA